MGDPTSQLPELSDLLEDHDLLLAALGSPAFWQREFADDLDGEDISTVEVSPVGTGQVASCMRVTIGHGASSSSVVVKTGSDDPVSRSMSATLRHGEIETGFYSKLADHSDVRAPTCHLSAINAANDDFVLVLEDLHTHDQADQIAGMTPEEAAAAIEQLAALHATWWGRVPPGTEGFMVERGDPHAHGVLLGMLHQGFTERYGDDLGPEVMAVADRLVAGAGTYLANRPGPTAVVHGDFRPDNLLVPRSGIDDTIAVVDWQTVVVGAALGDVSYFLGGALVPELRRDHEDELLAAYRAALGARGVDISAEEVLDGYRRYSLDGLVMAIGASQVVGQTDRGDEMFKAMAQRSAVHALESGALDLLG